jgi:hypothetical protein
MVELSGAELDAVTGGQANGVAVAAGGLVNVALGAANVDVLRNANINLNDLVDITIRNVANNNNISVGRAANSGRRRRRHHSIAPLRSAPASQPKAANLGGPPFGLRATATRPVTTLLADC